MSKDPRHIVRRPLITEKGNQLRIENNSYLFEVDRKANKIEIAGAIAEIFDVKVEEVRTINCSGKTRRSRGRPGKRPDWKKAIITLDKEDTIDVVDQV